MFSSAFIHVFRLKPHEDLKESIEKYLQVHRVHAGVIVTCVGSLEQRHLRFANQVEGDIDKQFYEIVSLTGTVSVNGSHLHACLSDAQGKTIGGHLLYGNIVYTTAEIAIAALPEIEFHREVDETYGYRELKTVKS
jgi:predicted DNA-binding protein with PD1-like motif